MTLLKDIGQDDRINPTINTKEVVLKNKIYYKEQFGQKKNEDVTVLQGRKMGI